MTYICKDGTFYATWEKLKHTQKTDEKYMYTRQINNPTIKQTKTHKKQKTSVTSHEMVRTSGCETVLTRRNACTKDERGPRI